MARTLEELKDLIGQGNYHAFLVSGFWKEKRIDILKRDFNECQRCNGKWNDPRYPLEKRIELKTAILVHHIVPAKENMDLLLDDDNLISLCWHCHEIVEGRTGNIRRKKKAKPITEERW